MHFEIVVFLLVSSWRLADCQQSTSTSHRQSNTGWGLIEVSPNAILSLDYQTFRVSVYKKQNVDANVTEYYYAPALILDPASAKSVRNPFSRQFETTFEVLMYDAAFEKAVQDGLSAKLGGPVPLHSIRILPIEQIRIDMIQRKANANYEINNQWTSYAYHPERFSFSVTCLDEATCIALSQDIKDYPKLFVASLEVYFSLQTQRSRRRQIKVKVEHALSAPLYARLAQEFPHTDTVYMTSTELKKMTMEIATNVLASEMIDDDYVVGADQTISVAGLLSSLLQVKSTMSDAFTKEMWKSVFWNEDSARPDMITQELNDVYGKSDATSQEAMRSALNTSTSRLTDTASDSLSKSAHSRATQSTSASSDAESHSRSSGRSGSASAGAFGFSAGGSASHQSANTDSRSSSNSASNAASASGSSHEARAQSALDAQQVSYDTADGRERLQTLLKEGRNVAQWDGRKFVPKAMELSRINLATFRSQTTGIATQVNVIRTTSELSSSINVVEGMAGQTPTQFCIGLTCLTVEDFQRVRDLHNGKLKTSKITVATDGQFCLGSICFTEEDLRRVLDGSNQLVAQRITGGQFCIGFTCLDAEDFQRLHNLPNRLATKIIAAPEDGQYCVGASCIHIWDIQRLLTSAHEIKAGKISTGSDGQFCVGAVCLRSEDFQLLRDLRLRNTSLIPFGGVSGWVSNAATGLKESDVQLTFRAGSNVRVGDPVMTANVQGGGLYDVSLPVGHMYTVEASKPGFITTYSTVPVVAGEVQLNQQAIIWPVGINPQIRIVLTWIEALDLDACLTGPDKVNGSGRFSLRAVAESTSAPPFASRDADSRGGNGGQETVTIAKQLDGLYRYSVWDYTNRAAATTWALAFSHAKVKVIRGSSVIQIFTAPNHEGNLWTVFEMDADRITPVNTVKYNRGFESIT